MLLLFPKAPCTNLRSTENREVRLRPFKDDWDAGAAPPVLCRPFPRRVELIGAEKCPNRATSRHVRILVRLVPKETRWTRAAGPTPTEPPPWRDVVTAPSDKEHCLRRGKMSDYEPPAPKWRRRPGWPTGSAPNGDVAPRRSTRRRPSPIRPPCGSSRSAGRRTSYGTACESWRTNWPTASSRPRSWRPPAGRSPRPSSTGPHSSCREDRTLVLPWRRACIVRFFCVGESVAVPLFRMLRERCSVPIARRALDRVMRDEPRHRQFGWDVLDWLLLGDEVSVLRLASRELPAVWPSSTPRTAPLRACCRRPAWGQTSWRGGWPGGTTTRCAFHLSHQGCAAAVRGPWGNNRARVPASVTALRR